MPAPLPATSTAAPVGTPAPVESPGCQASEPPMAPMPQPGRMPANSVMAKILKRGYLIAGVDQDSYGWGFPNPSPSAAPGESFQGFDADMVHALAHAVFGDADAVRFVAVGQDYRLGVANQGIVDVVASSITITCDRKKQVGFSVNYIDGGAALLVPRQDTSAKVVLDADNVPHIKGLEGRKVCTVGSTTSVTNLSPLAKEGRFGIVLANNWSDCLIMLQQGTVQAFSTDNTILGGMQAEDPYLKLVDGLFSDEPHGLAFPLTDSGGAANNQIVGFANGVIAQMEARSPRASWCPQPMTASDRSCWDAVYRRWVQPQLGDADPPVASYTR
ncbi:transporter substrate-binding domain-containing protein [Streptomyces sp. NBC_01190]|uniref:transporter substrate-binding domain-containing protein n=1 Tax=Streptomyces sp. NBC_01190 TaxID=2903767 RepID=UPI00386848FE|nr:transporter substrate-binding domain-containing protein [Streptomyces sp. NBC_01190]